MRIGQLSLSTRLSCLPSFLTTVALAAVLAGAGGHAVRGAMFDLSRRDQRLIAVLVEDGESGQVVAQVVCTAYTSCMAETDSTPEVTASNQRVAPGMIALSRDLISKYTPGAPFAFGDEVELVGIGIFRVEDTMHSRWSRRADILLPSREEAVAWGRRTVVLARPAESENDLTALLDQGCGNL